MRREGSLVNVLLLRKKGWQEKESRVPYRGMRTFILLSAIPGSGKSTWAKQYAKTHANTKIVSSDEIRLREFGKVDDFSHEADLWRMFLEEIHTDGKDEDVTVIADSTNITNHYRQYYAEETPEFDHKILVCFDLPFQTALAQNNLRTGDRVVPQHVMESMHKDFEAPDETTLKMYDEYLLIDKDFIAEELRK